MFPFIVLEFSILTNPSLGNLILLPIISIFTLSLDLTTLVVYDCISFFFDLNLGFPPVFL